MNLLRPALGRGLSIVPELLKFRRLRKQEDLFHDNCQS